MKKILITEDELLVARVYAMQLQRLGYEILSIVSDGNAAVEKCRELQPDVVLMDVNLRNNTNGFEAARKIRAFSSVPVIFTTGNAATEAEKECADIPRSCVLVKPVEPVLIVRQIEKFLGRA